MTGFKFLQILAVTFLNVSFSMDVSLDVEKEKDFFLVKNEIRVKLGGEKYRKGKFHFRERDINYEVIQADHLYTTFNKENPYKEPSIDKKFFNKRELKDFFEKKIRHYDRWIHYTERFLKEYDVNSYQNYPCFYAQEPFSKRFSDFLSYQTEQRQRWLDIKQSAKSHYDDYLLVSRKHPHDITGVSELHRNGLSGSDASVVVWDCGFLDHKCINYTKSDNDQIDVIPMEIDEPTSKARFSPDQVHGTHVSGIIAATKRARKCRGVAYGANVLPVSYEGVPDLIERIKDSPAKIISASFHFLLDKNNVSDLDKLANELSKNDRILVLASGNDSLYLTNGLLPKFDEYWFRGMWFGNHISKIFEKNQVLRDRMLLVGSLREDGVTVSKFSNLPGEFSDIFVFAPGENIRSSIQMNDFGPMSGTSMATPHVSGILVLLSKQYPDLSALELKECLLKSCEPFWIDAGNKFSHDYDASIHGKGRVNALKAMEEAEKLRLAKQMHISAA